LPGSSRTFCGDPTALDTYEPERAPVGRMVLRFTDRAFTVATSTSLPVRFVRARVVPSLIPLVLKARLVRGLAFRTLAELAIRYRSSPLSVKGPQAPRRGPKAGDRLPDAPIVSYGRMSSLHAAVAAPGWHLLLCGPTRELRGAQTELPWEGHGGVVHVLRIRPGGDPRAAKAEPGVLHDSSGVALHRLGVRQGDRALYLVRPDGHVGYRSGGDDLDGLMKYLRRWVPGEIQGGSWRMSSPSRNPPPADRLAFTAPVCQSSGRKPTVTVTWTLPMGPSRRLPGGSGVTSNRSGFRGVDQPGAIAWRTA
jgi:hypothetical protein